MDTDKRMDILVSNAAANPYFGPILLTPEKAWDKIFDVNVKNTFQLIQECVPHLEEAPDKSSITCISSIAGFQPMPMLGAYSVQGLKIECDKFDCYFRNPRNENDYIYRL